MAGAFFFLSVFPQTAEPTAEAMCRRVARLRISFSISVCGKSNPLKTNQPNQRVSFSLQDKSRFLFQFVANPTS